MEGGMVGEEESFCSVCCMCPVFLSKTDLWDRKRGLHRRGKVASEDANLQGLNFACFSS